MNAQSRLLPMAAIPHGLTDNLLLSMLEHRLAAGQLTVILPSGESRVFTGSVPGPRAEFRLHRLRALRRLITGGPVGLGEAYMDGDWDSPDLAALLELGDVNDRVLGDPLEGHPLLRLGLKLWHRLHDNSRRGSRRNISAHYDLGNAFYSQWLDPGMTYSAALFASPGESLAQAQERKYRAIAEDIGLKPGMRVLEIGCGWGGFAELMAGEYGATVVGLTLSEEQHAWATRRLAEAGLAERTDIRLQDYRDVTGQFDRIVSVEMIEAVGERWWPTYFATIRDRLVPGGKAGLQAITIADERFDTYRRGCDFIQRHVFPGGMLPSPGALQAQADAAGLSLSTPRCFGMDYERTLGLWEHDFQQAWSRIAPLGFDTRFKRLWEFYIAYCRAGFRTKAIDVCHLLLTRD
ncbi:S-adenosyl-L-methionine dependent methyltransferase [Paramagnetospirillum magnetotacticum MS-1]|uniref:S-adenosyl-L-methionine dependent methyltransferase n=1 Tax=Paramagnetospirillum magnetotacticum MS-1 TaxID=272627 RepID=A0A0C2YRE0_PARME|nr:cyclopropane-fatty-acyl-phospholipid synthase family protein [Paramagnetospirillum magnetotacticum]KIL97270.1 S-adenosyl-L-methionine dependent methyltransferase [Paramagnetospirillum magnetotacticum MS-1]